MCTFIKQLRKVQISCSICLVSENHSLHDMIKHTMLINSTKQCIKQACESKVTFNINKNIRKHYLRNQHLQKFMSNISLFSKFMYKLFTGPENGK